MAAEVDVDPPVPRGLLVDWGGVLTTDVFVSFQRFCRNEGLDQTRRARPVPLATPRAGARCFDARDRAS